MRHLKSGRKLGRNASHRLALYRNLAMALFRHERIITTLQKAKAVRPFIEKLITQAKKGTLHARRPPSTSARWVWRRRGRLLSVGLRPDARVARLRLGRKVPKQVVDRLGHVADPTRPRAARAVEISDQAAT